MLQVLVICGDQAYARYLSDLLAAAGHAATTVATPGCVLATLRQLKPELAIWAAGRAELAAWSADARLHRPPPFQHMPLVVVSEAAELEPDLPQAFDFLTLPLDAKRLLSAVAAVARHPAPPESSCDERQLSAVAERIHSRYGLDFRDRNRSSLARALKQRMDTLRLSRCPEYLDYLQRHGDDRQEYAKLLQYLTVGETSFFRYPSHYQALRDHLRQSALANGRLRIWSAGCSTGEEAYSIAIAVMQALPDWRRRDVKILATDLNGRALRHARRGVYLGSTLRKASGEELAPFFRQQEKAMALADEVRGLVEFSPGNLFGGAEPFLDERFSGLDAIFCRNVLIYFSAEAAERTLLSLAGRLKENGLMFLGHSEPLFPGFAGLKVRHSGNGYFYQKEAAHASPPREEETARKGALGHVRHC